MSLLEKQLVIKKSTIPGSGLGLFTKKLIPKGTRIVEYKGKITTWKDANHNDGKNYYLFFVKRTHVIDSMNYKKSLARYSNDANGATKIKGIKNNATYFTEGLRIFVEAIADIPPDTEIFVDYGEKYWRVFRRLKLQEEKAAAKKNKPTTKRKAKTTSKTANKRA